MGSQVDLTRFSDDQILEWVGGDGRRADAALAQLQRGGFRDQQGHGDLIEELTGLAVSQEPVPNIPDADLHSGPVLSEEHPDSRRLTDDPDGYENGRSTKAKRHGDQGALPPLDADDADAAGDGGDGPPSSSASKGDWVEYAVASGADRADAEGSTKADLQDRYGS